MVKSILLMTLIGIVILSCGSNPTDPLPYNYDFVDSTDNPVDSFKTIEWKTLPFAFNESSDKNDYSVIMFGNISSAWSNKFRIETLIQADVIQKLGIDFNTIWINTNDESIFNYKGSPVSASYLADSVYNVTILPSLNFLNRSGKFLIQFESFRDSLEMLEILKYISSGNADTLAQDTITNP